VSSGLSAARRTAASKDGWAGAHRVLRETQQPRAARAARWVFQLKMAADDALEDAAAANPPMRRVQRGAGGGIANFNPVTIARIGQRRLESARRHCAHGTLDAELRVGPQCAPASSCSISTRPRWPAAGSEQIGGAARPRRRAEHQEP